MRILGSLALVGLFSLCACSKPQGPSPSASAQSSSPSPAPSPSAQAPTQPPADLAPGALSSQLRCGGGRSRLACQIVDEFESAKAWNLATIPGEEGRFFGRATRLEGAKTTEHWYFLVVKKVPTNEVSPGDLPISVALRELDAEHQDKVQAARLLRILQTNDAVTRRNATASYLLDYAPSSWDSAAASSGRSTVLHIGTGAYVRQSEDRKLIIARLDPNTSSAQPGDGLVMTLWPLSW